MKVQRTFTVDKWMVWYWAVRSDGEVLAIFKDKKLADAYRYLLWWDPIRVGYAD